MLSKKFKDIKFRNFFFKKEHLKNIYKFLKINFLNNKKLGGKSFLVYNNIRLQKKILRISKTKIQNRCVLTNRNRGIVREYGISRLKLRELLQFGVIPGYKKAVW